MSEGAEIKSVLPSRPIEKLVGPIERFLHVQSASGLVLMACTVTALVLANSRFAPAVQAFWDQRLVVSVGSIGLDYPLWYWVNDGLMTLFFFVIGLEIKREMVAGELSEAKNLVLPVAAAAGGALVPVLVFLLFLRGGPGARAWAVPMATDIAFVVGCLSLLGDRVPRGLKVFVLSLAIVDDIFAVLVIAAFYSSGLKLIALVGAGVGLGVVVALNRLGVRAISVYVFVGAISWLFMLKSGIHPTVAGVALGLLTPASAWTPDGSLQRVLSAAADAVEAESDAARKKTLQTARFAVREAVSPLDRLEAGLHGWVAFLIMPVFALANAGVAFRAETLASPLALAVAAGLVLGKPIGIVAGTLLVVKAGWSSLPEGTSARALVAAGALAGIGFTMSLFVASLGLEGQLLQEVKGGVLVGSAVSMAVGLGLLYLFLPKAPASSA
ncbi:MAG: Na+/H+ antiporter NhaA [Myxococcales bacterium]|nr:Na+/H+ antiporter NhaA [Myxococcales bacterium]